MKLLGLILIACIAAQAPAADAGVVQLICPSPSAEAVKAGGEAKKAAALHKRMQTIDKNINAADSKGITALMAAAELDNRTAVCYLIARGADPTLADKEGKTAATRARSATVRELLDVCSGSGSGLAMAQELIERKAQQEGLGSPEERRARLWKLVATPGKLKEIVELLRMNVDTDGPGPGGITLLQVKGVCPEYVAYFVRRGYNLNSKGEDGSCALSAATSAPTARLMLALGLKPDAADTKTSLLAAIFSDDTKEVQRLLKQDDTLLAQMDAEHPLLALAQSGAMVRLLAEAGAKMPDVSSLIARTGENPRDASVIHALVERGAPVKKNALLALCALGSADADIARLLANSETLSIADEGGTALHYAAARGRAATVKVLLGAGCDPNQTNAAGDTPLLCLLKNLGKSTPAEQLNTVKALIKSGAQAKAKDAQGQSAQQLAKTLNRSDLLKAMKSAK